MQKPPIAREKPWELRRRLEVETFARIREDYARASVQVLRLLKEIEKRLFDSELQIRAKPAMMLDGHEIAESSALKPPATIAGAWKPVLRSRCASS